MRFTPGGRGDIEDRRSGGGMGRGLGIGGTVIVLALSLITGRNLFSDLGVQPGVSSGSPAMTAEDSAREEPEVQFVASALNDAQETWQTILSKENVPYERAKLVLFRNSTDSGCGPAQSAMGPFYCPVDQRIYIDLAFYDELKTRFGATGDAAQAYVIAHELGHHIQHLTGTDARVRQAEESNPDQANQYSVRLELQADCYAGVWVANTGQRGHLQPGDIQEAMNAAASVGDDRIQKQETGRVNVDSFTHGSSAQRMEWFNRGYKGADMKACDTFTS